MKDIIIRVNNFDFLISFKNEGNPAFNMRWSGIVAEIQKFDDETWAYQSNKDSGFVEDLKDARIWFEWSFCWRGVWEGRIYFKDDEYWSGELRTIPLIWEQIETIMKNKIKADNPDYEWAIFDE